MIDVINPVVEHVTGIAGSEKIGVIGTKGTIKSDIYAKIHAKEQETRSRFAGPPCSLDDRRGFSITRSPAR